MWAIMRATSIASWVRIAWRATFQNAMFCAVSRAVAHTSTARSISSGMVERPLQDLHAAERAADRGVQPLDPELAQQRAVHGDHVAHREQREVQPVALAGRGVRRRRPGRPLAPAEDVRADDVEAVGVDRLARPDQRVPPVRRLGVAGQRVADVDDRVRRDRRSVA